MIMVDNDAFVPLENNYSIPNAVLAKPITPV
jgi:hypothetical protein